MGRLQTLAAQAMLVRRGESTRSSGLWALEVEEVELGAEEAQISGGGGCAGRSRGYASMAPSYDAPRLRNKRASHLPTGGHGGGGEKSRRSTYG